MMSSRGTVRVLAACCAEGLCPSLELAHLSFRASTKPNGCHSEDPKATKNSCMNLILQILGFFASLRSLRMTVPEIWPNLWAKSRSLSGRARPFRTASGQHTFIPESSTQYALIGAPVDFHISPPRKSFPTYDLKISKGLRKSLHQFVNGVTPFADNPFHISTGSRMDFPPVFAIYVCQRLSIGDSHPGHQARPLARSQKHRLAIVVMAEKLDYVLFRIGFARSIQDSFPNHSQILCSSPAHANSLRRENGADRSQKDAPIILRGSLRNQECREQRHSRRHFKAITQIVVGVRE